jgi:hypothetical protein
VTLLKFVESGLEGGDEVGVHELEIVGNVEAVNRFFGDGFGEFGLEVSAVFAFHHKDVIGPAEEAFGDADAGGAFGAGGFNLVAGCVAENFFGGAAAPFVHAADEEKFGGMGHCECLIEGARSA